MQPSLSSVYWKIDRAKHHANELNVVLNTWAAREADEPILTKLNADRKTFNVPQSSKDFHFACALIVGDFVHNLRSALDHLVLQLALVHKAPFEEASALTYFPICETGDEFRSSIKPFRHCISLAARAALKRCQPYVTAQEMRQPMSANYLLLISKLDNVDKHRLLVVIRQGSRITDVTITAPDGIPIKPPITSNLWMAIEDRAELAGVDLSGIDLNDEMHMDVCATIEVFLNDPAMGTDALPVRSFVNGCVTYVDLLVREFEREFFRE